MKTIAFLEAYLKELGIPTINIPDGGLLGIIDSGKPGKTLLMRADTDALPIAENPENLKEKKVLSWCAPPAWAVLPLPFAWRNWPGWESDG